MIRQHFAKMKFEIGNYPARTKCQKGIRYHRSKLKVFRLVFGASICLVISYLNTGSAFASEEICFPQGYSQSESATSTNLTDVPAVASLKNSYVFIDSSPNMVGLVNAADSADGPSGTKRMLFNLPFALSSLSEKVRYHQVQGSVTPKAIHEGSDLLDRSLYQCEKGKSLSQCLSGKSALSIVLPFVASGSKDDVYILVSDLSLDGKEFIGGAGSQFRKSIERILGSERAIGIVAVRGKFEGVVYDLPSGGRYSKANKRPLYLMAFGERNSLLKLFGNIEREVLSNVPTSDKKLVIFTKRVVKRKIGNLEWKDDEFNVGKGIQTDSTHETGMPRIRKYILQRKHYKLEAKIGLDQVQLPYSLPATEFELEQKLWQRRRDSGKCSKQWLQLKGRDDLISVSKSETDFSLNVFNKQKSTKKLPSRRTYFLSSEVLIKKIGLDASLSSWAKEWSYDDLSEKRLIAEKPSFFPTLNLDRLLKVLADSVLKTFEPERLARFDAIFHIDR